MPNYMLEPSNKESHNRQYISSSYEYPVQVTRYKEVPVYHYFDFYTRSWKETSSSFVSAPKYQKYIDICDLDPDEESFKTSKKMIKKNPYSTDYWNVIHPNTYNLTFNNSYLFNSSILHENIVAQNGGTCYAHAAAAAVIATLGRLHNLIVPSHKELAGYIISNYGWDGANTYDVLGWLSNKFPISRHYVNSSNAIKALDNDRIIVGSFWFTELQWKHFCNLGSKFGNKVLEKGDVKHVMNDSIRLSKDDTKSTLKKKSGHSIAIVGYGYSNISTRLSTVKDGVTWGSNYHSEYGNKRKLYWKIRNSFGTQWGDKGYFRMTSDCFNWDLIDVYYTISNLKRFDLLKKTQTKEYVTTEWRRSSGGGSGGCVVL